MGLGLSVHPYAGATFALLTQHGKERVFAPRLMEAFGAKLEVVSGFDTDRFGAFTREVPRAGTQLEAARAKARAAVELSRHPLGLGSEGAFVPFAPGLGVAGVELVVLVDRERALEIVGRAEGPGRHDFASVESAAQLVRFAVAAGFPQHGLTLRPDHADHPFVQKGLTSWPSLTRAFQRAQAEATSGAVFVEHDLRAHQNPTRMALIASAVADCLARMQRLCPGCGAPGFGVTALIPGRPCADCGAPTRRPMAERWGCVKCPFFSARTLPVGAADPGVCDACNP